MNHLFPTIPINCIESYARNKEILNVKGQKSYIDTTNQQCSNFRYSIYLQNSLFKNPKGNNVPSFELNYVIGKIINIQGYYLLNDDKIYFNKFGVITDISYNGFGNTILDVITNKILCNESEPIYEYITYYPISSIAFINYFNEISYENEFDTILSSIKNYYIDISNNTLINYIDYYNDNLYIISPFIKLNDKITFKSIELYFYQIDCDISKDLEHILHFYIEEIKSKCIDTITFKIKSLNVYHYNELNQMYKIGTICEIISNKNDNKFSFIIQSENLNKDYNHNIYLEFLI